MTRRRRQSDELRAAFVANREHVRSWLEAWEIPEIVWTDEFNEIPSPWIVAEKERESWLKRHAPFMNEYDWRFFGRPLTPGVREVRALWHFGAAHRFEKLDLTFVSVCDPEYLAEKLTMAVHHADLRGWRNDDAEPLYQWLVEGVSATPLHVSMRGSKRSGFVLLDFLRLPASGGNVMVQLTAVPTDRSLDGSPLADDGGSLPPAA